MRQKIKQIYRQIMLQTDRQRKWRITIRSFFSVLIPVTRNKLLTEIDVDVIGIELDGDVFVHQIIRDGIEVSVDLNERILVYV